MPIEEALDTERLFSLLKKHKLLRFFAYTAFAKQLDIPLSISQTLKQLLILADIEKQVYRQTLNLVGILFNEAEISYCLLKGYNLGEPDIPRDVNDLDILIRERDLEKADKLLRESGFYYVGDARKAYLKKSDYGGDFTYLKKWSNQFEYRNKKNDLLLETTYSPIREEERVHPFNVEKIWDISDSILKQAAFSTSSGCRVLQPAHSLWLMAMHNAFRRSVCKYMLTLRYIGDMHYLISQKKADWAVFIKIASQTGTRRFFSVFPWK